MRERERTNVEMDIWQAVERESKDVCVCVRKDGDTCQVYARESWWGVRIDSLIKRHFSRNNNSNLFYLFIFFLQKNESTFRHI